MNTQEAPSPTLPRCRNWQQWREKQNCRSFPVPSPVANSGNGGGLGRGLLLAILAILFVSGCNSSDSDGLKGSPKSETTVKFDFFHKPLPEIPLPNDIATTFDKDSPTKRRVNASMIAPSTAAAIVGSGCPSSGTNQ